MKSFDIENYTEFDKMFNDFNNEFIIINITAIWCKPCIKIKENVITFINNINKTNAIFLRIDYNLIEDDENFMNFFDISKIPYFYIYKNKSKVKEFQNNEIEYIKNEINKELFKNDNMTFELTEDF